MSTTVDFYYDPSRSFRRINFTSVILLLWWRASTVFNSQRTLPRNSTPTE